MGIGDLFKGKKKGNKQTVPPKADPNSFTGGSGLLHSPLGGQGAPQAPMAPPDGQIQSRPTTFPNAPPMIPPASDVPMPSPLPPHMPQDFSQRMPAPPSPGLAPPAEMPPIPVYTNDTVPKQVAVPLSEPPSLDLSKPLPDFTPSGIEEPMLDQDIGVPTQSLEGGEMPSTDLLADEVNEMNIPRQAKTMPEAPPAKMPAQDLTPPAQIDEVDALDTPPSPDDASETDEKEMHDLPKLPEVPSWDDEPVTVKRTIPEEFGSLPEERQIKEPDVVRSIPSTLPDLELMGDDGIDDMDVEKPVDTFVKLQDDLKRLNQPL
ncbi:hypothetical protein COT47_02295, partial [Candidatus Woesearchaeota archaeon CG08_land_8_20_14_0_20_43_7]